MLKWLGRRHVARRSSDQLLTLEAMWLLFAVVQSVGFAFEGLAWLAAGPLAFLAWKLTTVAGFRLAGLGHAQAPEPGLLLLRVFALGARSERLFDAFGKRWLRIGNIDMIAGPDLATTAVEPHEFLDFVGGRLSRAFVHDEADLARRHAARALGPDPDGRHRVNEFFCHDDTWRPTMLCLARAADAVLMDLRGFSPQNEGCRYELQQLLDHVALERVVVLVGRDTERGFLDSTLAALWQSSRADSPNRDNPGPLLRMVRSAGTRPPRAWSRPCWKHRRGKRRCLERTRGSADHEGRDVHPHRGRSSATAVWSAYLRAHSPACSKRPSPPYLATLSTISRTSTLPIGLDGVHSRSSNSLASQLRACSLVVEATSASRSGNSYSRSPPKTTVTVWDMKNDLHESGNFALPALLSQNVSDASKVSNCVNRGVADDLR